MRSIKFRFFCRKTNKMMNVEGIDFKFNKIITNYKITDVKCQGDIVEYTQESHDILHHNELMQFTGLHDKNDKEIYEGDIVKFNEWNPKVVVYMDKSFAGFTLKDTLLFLTDYDAKEIEIIGNIYENPELLGEK